MSVVRAHGRIRPPLQPIYDLRRDARTAQTGSHRVSEGVTRHLPGIRDAYLTETPPSPLGEGRAVPFGFPEGQRGEKMSATNALHVVEPAERDESRVNRNKPL